MQRALSALNKGDRSVAESYIADELAVNPQNGDAYVIKMHILYDKNRLGDAMMSAHDAMKYLSKKDKYKRSYVYLYLAKISFALQDTIQGLKYLNDAVKLSPKDLELLSARAEIYSELKDYDQSDRDYNQVIKISPSSMEGRVGLGQNLYERGEYAKAIEQYSRIVKLYPDRSVGYSCRAAAYLANGNYVDAMDDICGAIDRDINADAIPLLWQFPKEQLPLVVAKLSNMGMQRPDNAEWQYFIAQKYIEYGMLLQANIYLQKGFDINPHTYFLQLIASNCSDLGDFASAI